MYVTGGELGGSDEILRSSSLAFFGDGDSEYSDGTADRDLTTREAGFGEGDEGGLTMGTRLHDPLGAISSLIEGEGGSGEGDGVGSLFASVPRIFRNRVRFLLDALDASLRFETREAALSSGCCNGCGADSWSRNTSTIGLFNLVRA